MEGSKSSSDESHMDKEEKNIPFETSPLAQRTVHPTTDGLSQLSSAKRIRSQSRPSIRSHESWTDGYQVARENEDDEEKQLPAAGEQPSKEEFQVAFDGDNDPENPRSKTLARKWLINIITCSSAVCVTCASSMVTSTYTQLEREFGVSREVCTLALSIFVVGLGLGPMFLAPLSEFYGRRPIYVGAFGMFLIWLIPCAVARNIETLIIARFFNGLAGSAFLSVAGGTVGDMFLKSQLSLPMMIFTASPFLGPELGPVIAGFINQYADWRWTFYVLLIWAGVQEVLIIALVPETYHPVLLKRKAVRMRAETGNDAWYAPIERMNKTVLKTVLWSCIRPFQLLVFEPMCLCLCLLSAILLGILYLFFGAFPLVFENNYGFTTSQVGLAFIGLMVGLILGVLCDPIWRRNYARLVMNNGGVSEPEFRLPPTILGAIIVPIALFGFAWTTLPRIHWIVPIVFSGLFGFGNILCFGGIFTNHVETYPLYAASALAANSFARSSFAAAFPLFGIQMYENLGYQWASSLLAFLALLMMPFPYLFFKYGKRLRGTSRFAQA